MNAETKIEPNGLERLRAPFPANQISKLPKETRSQIDARKADKGLMVYNCPTCGGHHHKNAVHLDYVGHAALTDRLLDSDIEWTWEPLAMDETGLPLFDRGGGLWIKLTVCGVTRLGYGSADGKSGGDAIKEVIGDAMRNAAMRFGAALDLWHKGDLHLPEEPETSGGHSQDGAISPQTHTFPTGPAKNITELKALIKPLWREIKGTGDDDELFALLNVPENAALVKQTSQLEHPGHRTQLWEGDGKDNPGLRGVIEQQRMSFNTLQAG